MRHIRTKLPVFALLAVLPRFVWADIGEGAALIQQALERQQAGDYSGAAEAFRTVLKLNPQDVATHVNLGVVLAKLGRFDEAISEYQTADKLLPNDNRIALNIALAYQKSGRIKEAADRFASLHVKAPSEDQVTMLLADSELQLGDNDRVIELLQPLQSRNSDDLGLAYMLGMALLRQHRTAESQVFLDRILRRGDAPQARFLMGTRMFESGDYPSAVKELKSAVDLNAHVPGLLSLYGQALLNTGDPDAAAEAFRKELKTEQTDYDSNLGLGQILMARKQYIDSLPLLRQALNSKPDSIEARLAIAECLSGIGQFREAQSYAEVAVKGLPNSIQAHQALAAIDAGLHKNDEARKERERAASLANVADKGPQPNSLAPDFDLHDVTSGRSVSLHSYRGKSPLVLLFGSYSCPNFRSSAQALISLHQRYGAEIPFLLIYIREAHAANQWQSTRNERDNVALQPAITFAEKQERATMCSRKLHLPFPALVDGMDNAVEKVYNAWPSRAFVIGEDGRVLYSTRLTELEFRPQDFDEVLRRSLHGSQASSQ